MWGMRFLSAFLKVNPYFTLALAVGFSGVATIGFNHTETERALSKLIPLHLQSMFSDASSDKIVSDVPGMEQASQVLRSFLQPGSEWPVLPQVTFDQVLKPLSLKLREGEQWQDLALAGLNIPAADMFLPGLPNLPAQPDSNPGAVDTKTAPMADYPAPTSSPWPDLPRFGAAPGLYIPPSSTNAFMMAANVLPPAPPPPAPDFVPPAVQLPGPGPGPGPGQGTGGTSVGVAAPPMAVTFAALLPLLAVLRRRARKPAAV